MSFEEWFEDAMNGMDKEDEKSTEQLLVEFERGVLSEDGMMILIERGCRDHLLARCSTDEERTEIWFQFLIDEDVKQCLQQHLRDGKPLSQKQVQEKVQLVQQMAASIVTAATKG